MLRRRRGCGPHFFLRISSLRLPPKPAARIQVYQLPAPRPLAGWSPAPDRGLRPGRPGRGVALESEALPPIRYVFTTLRSKSP